MAKFQKGQSGNPGGRPKVVGELKNIPVLTGAEVSRVIAKYCRMFRSEIKEILENSSVPIYELNIASALENGVRKGDLTQLAYLFDRIIGKVKDHVDLTIADQDEELNREKIKNMPMNELIELVKAHLPKDNE